MSGVFIISAIVATRQDKDSLSGRRWVYHRGSAVDFFDEFFKRTVAVIALYQVP
jgi:hypothetical protein